MSPIEYAKLLEYIREHHSCLAKKGRKVKYIASNYDTRDNTVYSIRIREWFCKDFISFDKCAGFGQPAYESTMYERIINWLAEE